MLKIHVKLFSKHILLSLRDMEVGMIYKGNKGLPKIVVHKTARCITVRNVGEEKTYSYGFALRNRRGHAIGIRPMKVFAIAKNDAKDIKALVKKTITV